MPPIVNTVVLKEWRPIPGFKETIGERICLHHFACCHTETEVAFHPCNLTQARYIDSRTVTASTGPITSGLWQGRTQDGRLIMFLLISH